MAVAARADSAIDFRVSSLVSTSLPQTIGGTPKSKCEYGDSGRTKGDDDPIVVADVVEKVTDGRQEKIEMRTNVVGGTCVALAFIRHATRRKRGEKNIKGDRYDSRPCYPVAAEPTF